MCGMRLEGWDRDDGLGRLASVDDLNFKLIRFWSFKS